MWRTPSMTTSLHTAANPTPITALPMHSSQNDWRGAGRGEHPCNNAILSNQGFSPKLGEIPQKHTIDWSSIHYLLSSILLCSWELGRKKNKGCKIPASNLPNLLLYALAQSNLPPTLQQESQMCTFLSSCDLQVNYSYTLISVAYLGVPYTHVESVRPKPNNSVKAKRGNKTVKNKNKKCSLRTKNGRTKCVEEPLSF
jgi:hypothetical protein